jgi:hypothetical protein
LNWGRVIPTGILNTEDPAAPRHIVIPLATAFLVNELAVGVDGTAVGVAAVGMVGCADMFEMVSVVKEL